jgi:Ca2+-binding EF-hand superfamily protein
MDEMDMILMQPSNDKDTDISSPRIKGSFSFSSVQHSPARAPSHHHHRPLTFHLNTEEEHGGYVLSLSHKRIRHLREILQNTSLHKMESEAICNRVIAKASKSKHPRLTKEAFDLAISSILQNADDGRVDQTMFDMLSGTFVSFDRERSGKIGAHDVACGFTVLCNGKKSDKLEYAFEILDKRKRGHLSKTDLTSYLKSFLTVLLSIAFSPALESDPRSDSLTTLKGRVCENTVITLTRAADEGANWAAKMAFNSVVHEMGHEEPVITFDQFAEWYTSSGYSSIPWLELLDLRKWVFADA